MNFDPPWLPSGTVYGTLLNFRRECALWAPKMVEPPYLAAPRAPVLYVKTANTFAPAGAAVSVTGEAQLGATLGLVIGGFESNEALTGASQAQRAINHEVDALARVAGCVLIDDLSLPHVSYYRPAIRWRNRDGFLVCAPAVTPAHEVDLKTLAIETRVNGVRVQTVDLSTLVRDAASLLSDVSAFMTLQPGDVLLLGTDCLPDGTRPHAKAGDHVEISAPGLTALVHTLAREAA